ncbi:MAG: hypothetical protein RL291_1881 [Pseudomonadota bacterium]
MAHLNALGALALTCLALTASPAPLAASDRALVVVVAPEGKRLADAQHATAVFARQNPDARINTVVVHPAQTCPQGAAILVVLDRPCQSPANDTVPTLTTQSAKRPVEGPSPFILSLDQANARTAFAHLIADHVPPDARLAVVSDRTRLARELRKAATDRATLDQRAIVFNADFQAGARDYRDLAAKIAASGATDVAIAAFPAEAAILVRDLKALKPSLRVYGTHLLAADAFATQAGPTADDVRIALGPVAERPSWPPDQGTAFTELLQPVAALPANEKPQARATLLNVWLALEIAHQASINPPLAERLKSGPFETFLGPVRFDARGQLRSTAITYARWRQGRLVPQ